MQSLRAQPFLRTRRQRWNCTHWLLWFMRSLTISTACVGWAAGGRGRQCTTRQRSSQTRECECGPWKSSFRTCVENTAQQRLPRFRTAFAGRYACKDGRRVSLFCHRRRTRGERPCSWVHATLMRITDESPDPRRDGEVNPYQTPGAFVFDVGPGRFRWIPALLGGAAGPQSVFKYSSNASLLPFGRSVPKTWPSLPLPLLLTS